MYHSKVNSLLCYNNLGDFLLLHQCGNFCGHDIGFYRNWRFPHDVLGRNVIQYAEVRIDEDLLRRIASTTGGQYFNVKDPKGLSRALADIDKLEKTNIRKEIYNQYTELFPQDLWPGVLLLALAISLNMIVRKEII